MPSPLVHTLLPTALAASTPLPKRLTPIERLKFLALCVVLGNCPDFDLVPTIFDARLWTVVHRWYGHNLFTFAGLALAGHFAFKKLFPQIPTRSRWITVLGLIASHLILDGMVWPALPASGLPLWWPVSHHCWHMPIQLFPAMTQYDKISLIGYAVSDSNWKHVFGAELAMTLTLWVLLTLSGRLVWHFLGGPIEKWRIRSRVVSNPTLQSSPQYSPELPLPHRPDDIPSHTYRDSGLGS